MALNNPFFDEIHKSVKKEFDRRANEVSRYSRALNHEFNYRKTAYAHVETTDGSNFKLHDAGNKKFSGTNFTDSYNASGQGRYTPNPILTGVSVSNEGQLGSLRQIKVNFIIFDITQFPKYEAAFMVPGTELKVEVGWSVAGAGKYESVDDKLIDVNKEIYIGHVFDFGFTVRDDGGFDCSIELVAEGSVLKDIKLLANTKKGNDSDSEDINTLSLSKNLKDALNLDVELFVKKNGSIGSDNTPIIMKNGIYQKFGKTGEIVSFNVKDAFMQSQEGTKNASTTGTTIYVTLKYIVDNLVNRSLLETDANTPIFKRAKFVANEDVTATYLDASLFSADPRRIVFPGKTMGKYSDGISLGVLDDQLQFTRGELLDLSKILISYDMLIKKITEYEDNRPGVTLSEFFGWLFDEIKTASGEIYRLSLILNNDTHQIEIRDTNYTTVNDPEPYIFHPFGQSTIVRNMSMQSKVPNAYRVQMYVGGKKDLGPASPYNTTVTKEKSGANSDNQSNSLSPTLADGIDTKVIMNSDGYTYNPETKQYSNSAGEVVSEQQAESKAIEIINKNLDRIPLDKIKTDRLGLNGITDSEVTLAKKALRNYKITPAGANKWDKHMIFPIELSLTFDGIGGLKFGNIISSSWLPQRYKLASSNVNVVFVITNISHSIKDNDWTTTINTVMRITTKVK